MIEPNELTSSTPQLVEQFVESNKTLSTADELAFNLDCPDDNPPIVTDAHLQGEHFEKLADGFYTLQDSSDECVTSFNHGNIIEDETDDVADSDAKIIRPYRLISSSHQQEEQFTKSNKTLSATDNSSLNLGHQTVAYNLH